MNIENINTLVRYIEHTKRKISARDASGIAKIITGTKKAKLVNLHPIYNLAVKYNIFTISKAVAKKINRIKPASEQEKSLANAIIEHNHTEQKLHKKLFS